MTRDEGDIRLGENSLVVGCAQGNERIIIKDNWAKIGLNMMLLLLLYVIDLTYLSQVSNKHFQTRTSSDRYTSLTIMTA